MRGVEPAAHGLRRTNEDKRRAVTTLLSDPEWSLWSDREIARRCATGADMVGRLRADLYPSVVERQMDPPATRTVERNGTVYRQNTANIGRRAEPGDRAGRDGAAGGAGDGPGGGGQGHERLCAAE